MQDKKERYSRLIFLGGRGRHASPIATTISVEGVGMIARDCCNGGGVALGLLLQFWTRQGGTIHGIIIAGMVNFTNGMEPSPRFVREGGEGRAGGGQRVLNAG